MDKKNDLVISQTSAISFALTITIVLVLVLGLVCFRGQPGETYVLSFLIGCLPLTVVGLFKPIFNPYVNFWTRRSENDLSAQERARLQMLRGPRGKRATVISMFIVGALILGLYLLLNYVLTIEQHSIEDPNIHEGIALGSFFTFWLTMGYQIFFLSRALRDQDEN